MRTALISDIHGNLTALERVLADMENRSVDEIVCLGDILGYGPDPVQCVDIVAERCAFSLMGNHDYAVLYEPTNFNDAAKRAAYWTRSELERAVEQDSASGMKRMDFLNRLRVRWQYRDLYTCVHGTVRRPINEYLFAIDPIDNPMKVKDVFDRIPNRCLVGHTHVPGVFTPEPDFYPADELGHQDSEDPNLAGVFIFPDDEKAIVNPGSVGQPRDGNPKASYAILDTSSDQHRVEFVRIDYDIESVAERIHAIDELDPWLAERLFQGK